MIQGDCLDVLATLPADSVDLVFGSPPYERARTYGIDFRLNGQAWVDWMIDVYKACLRVCRGLVAFVVEGQTKQFRWSATPALLMADLHRAGVHLRKPPIFRRIGGLPGGGRDGWRNDYELVVVASRGGRLPWSDPTACGRPPVHQRQRIERVSTRRKDGDAYRDKSRSSAGPKLANPGNVIECTVGYRAMGSLLCHQTEAPFPERLAYPFVATYCQPGGLVLDPFSGSGTTVAVAVANGRRGLGIDLRPSQIDLGRRRLAELASVQTA